MVIPKNIFQTHKSEEFIKSKKQLNRSVHTWRKHTDYNYKFYDDNMCDIFIKENFNHNIYKAYQKCPLAVMKADLWRYCVIYKYGGIYADVDTVLNEKTPDFLVNKDALLIIVPENNVHFCNWVFAAPPNSPILKEIIDLAVFRILSMENIEGTHVVHYLTGPAVMTDGIIHYLKKNNNKILGESISKFASDYGDLNKYDCLKYVNYPGKEIFVFEPEKFHKNQIVHLFTGLESDGWVKESAIFR